jgi:hypothetical protein
LRQFRISLKFAFFACIRGLIFYLRRSAKQICKSCSALGRRAALIQGRQFSGKIHFKAVWSKAT